MFDPKAMKVLLNTHRPALRQLAEVEKALVERFAHMDRQVLALILAVASDEPLLLIGPTGVAKSRLVHAFCKLVGIDPVADGTPYFEHLLTPFTEPTELFGHFDFQALAENKGLHRIEDGMMQRAQVVFLDEVFNGSSAILNAILAFMNERIFHDRGKRKIVAMRCMFGATNELPQSRELRAVVDRFLLRCWVDNAQVRPKDQLSDLLERGWRESFGSPIGLGRFGDLFDAMKTLREDVGKHVSKGMLAPLPGTSFANWLRSFVVHCRQRDLSEVSNRRVVKMCYVLLIHRLYRAAKSPDDAALDFGVDEVEAAIDFFLDRREELDKARLKELWEGE